MTTPFYLLAATPTTETRLRSFPREGSDSPGWLLTEPPIIRDSGFNTSTGSIARLVGGEHWEVQSGDRKILRLYQDGSLFFRMRADHDFLAWALSHRDHYGQPTLNPVAVVECHLSFVYLLRSLASWFKQRPSSIRFSLCFSNASIGEQLIAVTKYMGRGYGWDGNPVVYPIHNPNAKSEVDIEWSTVVDSPDEATYKLLINFYDMFDAGPEIIPFVKQVPQGQSVDIEALKSL